MFLALIALLMQTISPVLAYAPQQTTSSQQEVAAACTMPNRPVQMESYVDSYHGRKTFWHAPWPVSTGEKYWGADKVAILDVTVDASGKLQKVSVVSTPDERAAQFAVRQFERITYRPALKNCVAVTSTFRTWYPARSNRALIYSIVSAVYPNGWSAQHPSSCRVPDVIHGGVPSLSGVSTDKALSASVRVDVASSGAVTGAAIASSSGNMAFDNAALAAARSATYPLNDSTGFKPVRPSGKDLSWNATHGYSSFSKCSPLPNEYVWTATFKPAGSSLFAR
jgi:TonB family protein